MNEDSVATAFDRTLAATTARCGAPLCVGIDPVADRLPETLADQPLPTAFESFSRQVIDAVCAHAAAVKFQSACYERLGGAGMDALARSMAHARDAGLAVILDAKRGDIGISARHYAAAACALGAQAITANAYMGLETLEPYLEAGLAVFVLVRTSNPGSADLQDLPLRTGGTLAMHLGRLLDELGRTRPGVHAVVGATQREQASVLRAVMPGQLFLLPGLGAQGATVDDLLAFARPPAGADTPDPTLGLLPTASRSVIYAWQDAPAMPDEPNDAAAAQGRQRPGGWVQAVTDAAAALNAQLGDALRDAAANGVSHRSRPERLGPRGTCARPGVIS
ncbi:MAG: orotidine 5'-phosphate decarboxylase [Phycisphaerales bacterium]|nr:MAG: orotidine 5'-phosphate decarboxylase [Phycisphaerales bacterium]